MADNISILVEEYNKYLTNQNILLQMSKLGTINKIKQFLERIFLLQQTDNKELLIADDFIKTFGNAGVKKYLDIILNPTIIKSEKQKLYITNRRNVVEFRYGKFSATLPYDRYDVLKTLGSDENIAAVLMRYKGQFQLHRQFAANLELYQRFVDEGANIEGFASPFNCQLLLCQPPYQSWQGKFCSLHYDVDKIFGSLGDFFLQDFTKQTVITFPPAVEIIITKTVEYILEQLDNHQCCFYVILPPWKDMEAYQKISTSKWLTHYEVIDNNKYPSENPFTGELHSGKIFELFVLKRL